MARITQRIGLPRYEADELYKRALAAYQKGQFDQAIDQMNKAIDLLPTRAEYWAMRGFIYLQDGVEDKAKADFEEALKHYRFEMLAHYGLGIIATKHKRWEESLAYFNSAAAAEPNRPETLYYLALIQHRLHDNNAAMTTMQRAVELFDKNGDKRKGDAQKWVREFERLLEKETQNQK
jgi:tetratricopeptide (TPR) repeat protein